MSAKPINLVALDDVDNWHFDEGDPEELFILEEEIASGSYGSVYKARYMKDNKIYALKIIQPEEDDDVTEFVELAILRHCANKNICKLLGTWKKEDETFIAIEYCGGGAISDFCQVWDMELTEEQIALVMRETLKGLKYLHDNCMVHRDIKGANILLTHEGDVKLVDFGVSAILASSHEMRNTLIGTPYWMAPEIIDNKNGNNPYSYAVDIWSVGITCVELAEKEPPLSDIHPMRALMMIPIKPPPTFKHKEKWSQNFVDFVACCLVKEPSKRPTAEELLKHPFVTRCKPKRILTDLMNDARQVRAQCADEDPQQEEPSEEEEETEDEAMPQPPPAGSKPDSAASPSKDKPASMNPFKQPAQASSPKGKKSTGPSEPKKRDAPQQRPQRKDRPTLKASRTATRREKNYQAKVDRNKKLMKAQLKFLRIQQARDLREREKLESTQKRERDTMQAQFKAQTSELNKKYGEKRKKGMRHHKHENDTAVASHALEVKNMAKKFKDEERQLARVKADSLKKTQSDLKSEEKTRLKDEKNVWRQAKMSKDQMKDKKMKFDIGWSIVEMERIHEVQTEALSQEHEMRKVQLEESYSVELKKFLANFTMVTKQQKEKFTVKLEKEKALQQLELEALEKKGPLLITHHEQMYNLESSQQQKVQKIEKDQSDTLLGTDQKREMKAFKRTKNQQKTELRRREQEFKNRNRRSMAAKEIKAKIQYIRDQFNKKQEEQEAAFLAKLDQQQKDEAEIITQHHVRQRESLNRTYKEDLKLVTAAQEKEISDLKERHIQAINKAEITYYQFLYQRVTQHQQKHVVDYHLKHKNDSKMLLEIIHKEQLDLIDTHEKELIALHERSGLSAGGVPEQAAALKKKLEKVQSKQLKVAEEVFMEKTRKLIEDHREQLRSISEERPTHIYIAFDDTYLEAEKVLEQHGVVLKAPAPTPTKSKKKKGHSKRASSQSTSRSSSGEKSDHKGKKHDKRKSEGKSMSDNDLLTVPGVESQPNSVASKKKKKRRNNRSSEESQETQS